MEIVYEPHPVSPERKAELKAMGVRIVDAQYKPADAPEAVAPEPEPAAVEVGPQAGEPSDNELRALAKANGWTLHHRLKGPALRAKIAELQQG